MKKTIKSRLIEIAVCGSLLMFLAVGSDVFGVDVPMGSKGTLRIETAGEGVFRVRLSPDGKFEESLLERYGILHIENTERQKSKSSDHDFYVETETASVSVNTKTGRIMLYGLAGKVLVPAINLFDQSQDQTAERIRWLIDYFRMYKGQSDSEVLYLSEYGKNPAILGEPQAAQKSASPTGQPLETTVLKPFGAAFQVGPDESFYGLGAASSERIQHRGHAYRLWAEYKGMNGYDPKVARFEQTEGPCPFLMSSAGWAVYVNTPSLHFFDVASRKTDEVFFWGPKGELDFFLFVSDRSLAGLIDQYTRLTGRPRLLPIWGYGLSYVGNIVQNQHESLQDALQFRQHGIPGDIFGLEPQWMKKFYDFSHDKEWDNHGRFYVPEWMGKEGTMIGALEKMGFKLSLWLCVDDDLTIEEERQIAARHGNLDSFPADLPDGWFEHLKKFVNQGVAAFKVDPSRIINTHFDRAYFNKCSDLEMHNLTQTLIQKQMQQGFEAHTNRRAMVHYCGSYTGVQQFGATTMGDNGGGPQALSWMLGLGLNGHMNTSCDMWPGDAAGIHFGFLMPWSQHNNWATCQQPWYLGKDGLETYRAYAKLRYALLPYFYSTAYQGSQTGMPMLRAMPLIYPSDPECNNLTKQYMLGDWLLSAVYTDEFYLPAGQWTDYWTGEVYTGPKKIKMQCRANTGGALLVKAGAILPMWPGVDHADGYQPETILLDIYPAGRSEWKLYEDDGVSLEYRKGQFAHTAIACEETEHQVKLQIEPREGSYTGMPKSRSYELAFHVSRPASITLNGEVLQEAIRYDADKSLLRITAKEPVDRQPLRVVLYR